MGTRSTTTILDNGVPLVCLYRQFDGYPQWHGKELAEFLLSKRLAQGLSQPCTTSNFVNDAGCLAAQMVAHFKTKPGGFYLVPPGQLEEFNYAVSVTDDLMVSVTVTDGDGVFLFHGVSPTDFLRKCLQQEA